MVIHSATGLWSTILSVVCLRIFSSPRRNRLVSFPGLASASVRWRRCSIAFQSFLSPLCRPLLLQPSIPGSEERNFYYAKRDCHQCDRERNPYRHYGG